MNLFQQITAVVKILELILSSAAAFRAIFSDKKLAEMRELLTQLRAWDSVGSLSTTKVPQTMRTRPHTSGMSKEEAISLAHFVNTISVIYGYQAGELLLKRLDPSPRATVTYYLQKTSSPKLYWVAALSSLLNQKKTVEEQQEILTFMLLLVTLNNEDEKHNYIDMDAIQERNYNLQKMFIPQATLNQETTIEGWFDKMKASAESWFTKMLIDLAPEPSMTQSLPNDSWIAEVVDDNVTGFEIDNPDKFNSQMFPNKF